MGNKRLISEFYELSYNQNDYEAASAYLAPSFFDHSPVASKSREETLAAIKDVHHAFPDLEVRILDLVMEDDVVVVQAFFSGTQAAPYLGVENHGNKIEFFALEMYRFNKMGKMIESWGYWPNQAIIEQLTRLEEEE